MRSLKPYFLLVAAIFAVVSIPSVLNAQKSTYYKIDVGFNVGVSNYLGEIGGKEKTEQPFIWDMKLSQTRWTLGGFARYKMNDFVSVRADLNYGRIQGADSLSENRGRVGRNLSFRNDMLEMTLRGEIYLYNMRDVGGKGWYRTDFKSYVFFGFGGVLHGPKALYQGDWVKLRPLQTEGIRYGLISPVIPVGLGFYFTHKRKYRFGWEMGWRMTFTDYLDDISTTYADPSTFNGNQTAIDLANRAPELNDNQRPALAYYMPGEKRGDSNDNDTYFFTQFSYSYVFRGKNPFYTQNYSWLGGRSGKRKGVRVKF